MTKIDNTVRSALTGRSPVVLYEHHLVREAAAILSDHDIGAAPVLGGGRLVGMFTERDILKRVVAAGRGADTTRIGEVMTPDPRTVTIETSLVNAFAMMIEGKFRHLPVVEADGRVIAVLSMRDVPLDHRIMHRQWTDWVNGKPAAAV